MLKTADMACCPFLLFFSQQFHYTVPFFWKSFCWWWLFLAYWCFRLFEVGICHFTAIRQSNIPKRRILSIYKIVKQAGLAWVCYSSNYLNVAKCTKCPVMFGLSTFSETANTLHCRVSWTSWQDSQYYLHLPFSPTLFAVPSVAPLSTVAEEIANTAQQY